MGGLFGSIDRKGQQYAIPWKRSQQAAVLVRIWQHVKSAAENSSSEWAASFRSLEENDRSPFSSPYSLLATDQGVRAILITYNTALQLHKGLPLEEWYLSDVTDQPNVSDVDVAIRSLKTQTALDQFLSEVAGALINNVDWRTSSHPGLSENEKLAQGTYRGSSGYAALARCALGAVTEVLGGGVLAESDIQEAAGSDKQN